MQRYRALRLMLAALLAVPMLYALAGLIGGVVPANRGWTQPDAGIRIYIEDNGIHTGIVLPAAGWDDIVAPEHFRDPRYAGHRWRSFGWGDRGFYIGTPTWADLDPLTVLRAGIGSDRTVMHVDAIPEPRVGAHVRAITVRAEEYARLVALIRAGFAPGAPIPGYGVDDVFYPATGRYSAIRTCNAWTGDMLRAAGVRIGVWTPFVSSVFVGLPS